MQTVCCFTYRKRSSLSIDHICINPYTVFSIDDEFHDRLPVDMDAHSDIQEYPNVDALSLISWRYLTCCWIFTPSIQWCCICKDDTGTRVACDGCRVAICVSDKTGSGCIILKELREEYGGQDESFYCPSCSDKLRLQFKVQYTEVMRLYPRLTLLPYKLVIRHEFPRPRRSKCIDDIILISLTYKDSTQGVVDWVISSCLELALSPLGNVTFRCSTFCFYPLTHLIIFEFVVAPIQVFSWTW